MRTIGVITAARSDFGIYVPILERLKRTEGLRAYIYATGTHLSPEFGLTVREIEEHGFEVDERIEMLLSSDSPQGIAKSMALGVSGFADSFERFRPDILLVLGDRFEMFCAVAAALPFKLPVAHLHGGETTVGAIDEAFRHAITKMSHLHFVAAEDYAERVVRMGENPARVVITGAPSLDNLERVEPLGRGELGDLVGLSLEQPFLLVTYHPVTLLYESTESQVNEVLAALEEADLPVILTYPNADTASRVILEKVETFVARHERAALVQNLGTRAYFSAMGQAAAMVGNSSSGIIEAASFRLPVVNIGPRQKGRLRAANVIDVECEREEIVAGIRRALSADFVSSLSGLVNPFGVGHAAERIIRNLRDVELGDRLVMKCFHESA